MKKLIAGFLYALIIVSFSATAVIAENSIARIKKAGEIVTGCTVIAAPTTFMDVKTNSMQGTMIDVPRYIAEKLNVKLRVVEIPWAALIPSLTTEKIDLISAAMVITEKRKEVIDFSDPIFPYCEGLVVPVNSKNASKSLADLEGLKIGAQVGTIYAKGLEERGFKEVKIYENIGEIMLDLNNERIDAAIIDAPVAAWLVKTKPEFKMRLVKTYQPAMCSNLAIGIRKTDQDLKMEINKILTEMRQKGMLENILTKYGQ